MRSFLRLSATFVALATLASIIPSQAQAQGSSVYVLGIRSIEGDDEFARQLSGVIRVAAGSIPGWEVAPDEVTLSQMTMMHGCAEPDRECMGNIAGELGAAKIIYGTIVRRGGDGFGLTLYLFDAASGNIEDQLTDTIPEGEQSTEVLRPRAQRYAAQLGGQARFGSLRLEAGQAGATVRVDQSPVGVTDDAGTILVEDLTEGSHEIEVNAVGFETFRTNIDIEADDQTEIRVNLNVPGEGGGANLGWIPGAALIAGGVFSMAMGIRSGAKVAGWQSDIDDVDATQIPRLAQCVSDMNGELESMDGIICTGTPVNRTQALVLAAPNNVDACSSDRLQAGSWQEATCDEHSKHQILQYVLYGIGAVGIGVGTFLLLRALGDDDDDTADVDVTVAPWMAGRDGGVDMTVAW